MPSLAEATVIAPTPAPSIVMCDEPGCTEPAAFHYTWAWGATGAVCHRHQFLRQQTSRNIKQGIQFHPIQPGQAPPVERQERVQLHAARLAAEDELKEAQGRTSALYAQNQELLAEVRRLKADVAELDASGQETFNRAERLQTERDRAFEELASARDRILKLETLNDALEGATVPLAVPVDRTEPGR